MMTRISELLVVGEKSARLTRIPSWITQKPKVFGRDSLGSDLVSSTWERLLARLRF
jgi:hypothetical protein